MTGETWVFEVDGAADLAWTRLRLRDARTSVSSRWPRAPVGRRFCFNAAVDWCRQAAPGPGPVLITTPGGVA